MRKESKLTTVVAIVAFVLAIINLLVNVVNPAEGGLGTSAPSGQWSSGLYMITDTWETEPAHSLSLPNTCADWGKPWVGLHDVADDSVITARADTVGDTQQLVVTFSGSHLSYLNATVFIPCLG